MKGVLDFLVKPKEDRYNNKKTVSGTELILNTELQNHNYVSRVGVVIAIPSLEHTDINIGDEVILHHNVFRRFRDMKGVEKNSKSYFTDEQYFVRPEQIFGYKKKDNWVACEGFNFIKPIKETKMFSIDFERPMIGVLKYKDKNLDQIEEGDLVGFRPGAEYEFIIDDEKLYRVPTNSITIKYEYQGDEEEYNPSWT
jgi:hypothetical protein